MSFIHHNNFTWILCLSESNLDLISMPDSVLIFYNVNQLEIDKSYKYLTVLSFILKATLTMIFNWLTI